MIVDNFAGINNIKYNDYFFDLTRPFFHFRKVELYLSK